MRWISASLLVLLCTGVAKSSGPPAVVSARTLLATNAVHPGQTAKLAVLARIEPGYHINDNKTTLDYLIPTRVEFDESPSLKVERVFYPRGKMVKFGFLDSPISVYEGEIRLGSVLKVEGSVKPGTYLLRGKFKYQACNDYACLPPSNAPFELSVRVAPPSVPLEPAHPEIFKTINFN